jgi:hypothetical protein
MLTDDEIRALRDKANSSFALCEVDPRNLDELAARLLSAESEVKRLNRYDWLKPDAYEKAAAERDD